MIFQPYNEAPRVCFSKIFVSLHLHSLHVLYNPSASLLILEFLIRVSKQFKVEICKRYHKSHHSARGVFGVDGIAVFVYFDVGYSVIFLKWCGISALENLAVNGF